MDQNDLLTHTRFVRALARSLVLDEARADDVEQDTWIAAIEHSPAADKPLRAWLSAVARNFARRSFRSEQRRRARERSVDVGCARSPDEILALEETRRELVHAVLALHEPYRSAILLRYYEDLPPGAVAERLQVSLATAKTRMRRGLQQLREQFAARYGDEKQWCMLLAPLAEIESSLGLASVAAATTLPFFSGVTIMKATIAVALFASVTVLVWRAWPRNTVIEPRSPTVAASPSEAREPAAEPVSASAAAPSRVVANAIATGIPISGTVTERATGAPVTRRLSGYRPRDGTTRSRRVENATRVIARRVASADAPAGKEDGSRGQRLWMLGWQRAEHV